MNFAAGKDGFAMPGPRITGDDIDEVVKTAGGFRFQPEGPESSKPKNADYMNGYDEAEGEIVHSSHRGLSTSGAEILMEQGA